MNEDKNYNDEKESMDDSAVFYELLPWIFIHVFYCIVLVLTALVNGMPENTTVCLKVVILLYLKNLIEHIIT